MINKDVLKAIGTGTVVGAGGLWAKKKIQKRMSNRNSYDPERQKTLMRLYQKIHNNGIKIVHDEGEPNYYRGKIYIPTQSPVDTVAHEFGHALNNRKFRKIKERVYGTSNFLTHYANPVLAGGGVAAYVYNKKQNPEFAKKIRNYSMAGQLAIATPLLTEELLASIRGASALKNLGDLRSNDLKGLGRSFATYGAKMAPTALAATYYAVDAAKDRKQKKKSGER